MPPGYIKDWHVGVRMTTGKKKLVRYFCTFVLLLYFGLVVCWMFFLCVRLCCLFVCLMFCIHFFVVVCFQFGFISGIPQVMRVYGKEFKSAEINYLCVHKKLRAHRLAPVLIQEVTRRVNLLSFVLGF